MAINLSVSDALIVVDVQNDFLPGGALAVPQGDQVIPVINNIVSLFDCVVLTQDWHPLGHVSFASSHANCKIGDLINVSYGQQLLWPEHCVQATHGAALASGLISPAGQVLIRKGFRQGIDSYSAFLEADLHTPTGLAGYLKNRDVQRCFVCGLATDFCVAWTACDACKLGFEVYVVADASQGIDTDGSLALAWERMQNSGVNKVESTDLFC